MYSPEFFDLICGTYNEWLPVALLMPWFNEPAVIVQDVLFRIAERDLSLSTKYEEPFIDVVDDEFSGPGNRSN